MIRQFTIRPEHVILTYNPLPGLAISTPLQDGLVVALDTTLTPELIEEGVAREVIHRIQGLRKQMGLAVTDKIDIRYSVGPISAATPKSSTPAPGGPEPPPELGQEPEG